METNVHHTWYNRAWYRTPVLRTLRNHVLVRTTLYVPVHKEMHANTPPPPKPSPELAMGAVLFLNGLQTEGVTDPVIVHMALSEHFLEQDNRLAQRIGHNLVKQTGYIKEGLPYEA